MIDLRLPALPDCLTVDGERYPIYTGFRTWIRFDADLTERRVCMPYIFRDRVPEGGAWSDAAVRFLSNENATPRNMRSSTARTVDYVRDGEYIVGAFQEAYGIDLTDTGLEMHWHRFLALFRCLPESTLMAQAMGYRSWRRDAREHDAVMRELKSAWTLPDARREAEKAEVLKLFNERYG